MISLRGHTMNLSFKHYYWRWLKAQIILIIIFLLLMLLARLGFSFLFGQWSELVENPKNLRQAFWLGLRFDLIPLAYINIIPFLLMSIGFFIPGKRNVKLIRSFLIPFLFIGYALLAWIFILDYAFYSYYQDHINILFFGLFEDDTQAVLISVWKNYNVFLWFSVIILAHYGLYRIIRFLFSPFSFDLKTKVNYLKLSGTIISGLVILAFMARGNFTRLPLSIEDAHISSNQFINKIPLNGVITLNRAIKIRKTFGKSDFNYADSYGFSGWQEAYEVAFNQKPPALDLKSSLKKMTKVNKEVEKNPTHMVVFIMESFGSYWNDHHSAEFNLLGELAGHFQQGILFNNFLSAENGTIGSVVSIATSQVIRPGSRFLSESSYMNTALEVAAHNPYKNAGYDTHFVYGGKLGWRDLGKYLSVQGYQQLWGADEIIEAMPELANIKSSDLGNEWGIFDEYLFSFIEEKLRTATKPQFFLVLTTSNHPPFEYPSSYNKLPLKLDDDFLDKLTIDSKLAERRFSGIQYANQRVGEFLTKIKEGPLKENVTVALTGDHSYWITKGVGHEQEFKRYAVPFFISLPDRLRPAKYDVNNFGSHEDIFPTLYNLTLSNQSYLKLGDDLINEMGMAMNSTGLVADKNGAFHNRLLWKWSSNGPQLLERSSPDEQNLNYLKQRAKALIVLTDLYLREEMKNKTSAAKNDRQ
jgi:phosphoglycerol transferase MdoB-like AlkP superfamily enzyme